MALICATIGRGRHSSLLEEWQAAAKAGAELVELRIDCLRREPDLKRLLKNRFTPFIFTVRRGVDGGMWRGDEEKRRQILREAIALGVDYVDLENDVAGEIRRFGKTKRIVSYHNLKKTPEDMGEVIAACAERDPDVVKVAVAASSVADASRVLQASVGAKHPTVAIAMGEIGQFTRILNAKFGAPFTFAGFNPERVFAAGMPFLSELKKDYLYEKIDADTEVYGVIGDPIGHSLSPAIHNAAFRELGLNKVLVPFLVPKGGLEGFFRSLEWVGVKGCSVTIPHKEDVIPLLKSKENSVERTGSCNTVAIADDGTKTGYNTDYRAAMDSLESVLGRSDDPESPSPLIDKQVLILGAGGVARSIAFGVTRRGASVTLTNRHDERAALLAEEVGCRSANWGLRATMLADVIVNCTPVGMHPNVDDTPLPPSAFQRPSIVVFDTIYHPENTMMLKLARERGCTTLTGVDMFLRQAALQFKIYAGREAPIDVMRAALKRKLGPLKDE
ncbi:shikimate dehydrogenase [Paludisphaera mucosa]|uniref:Multifunctional fusion protein n=1 Tax=Paludisphaera mucosa TaxID=3030827 RepID=A0ABT6F7U0_9BACT|nr:shikimate dehydrogenase [Paludisphaera mucosa]MDG3003639.1 shikimate dehydrogenase [Paludisphaera mucosa]